MHDRGDRVEVQAEHGGSMTTVSARLVVLATGAAGRALAPDGWAVGTHRYPDRYLMADVDDPTGAFADTAVITLDAAGVVESFPLPGGRRRLVAWVPRSAEADDAQLRSAVASRTGQVRLAAQIADAEVSSFGIRRSLAAKLRTGRVFGVGDAVHEVSPIGGQGMNLGLLDAVTLAPLLVEWLSRGEPVSALARWERHRLASARIAARLAGVNTAVGRPRGAVGQMFAMTALAVALSGPLSALPTRAYAMGLDRDARLSRPPTR
ncbi:MAG: FAD-dependent monooxygenase [Microbacterium sp.]|nr:MAG: FAD-dependent monooxygenase [Microbacterium sp.]